MQTIAAQEMLPARFHPRVEAGFMVKLFTNGRAVIAKAMDLSMAGLKLVGDFSQADERVTLSIPVPGGRDVVAKGTMRRRSKQGAAIEFDQLDWEDLFVLAKYLHPRLK